MSSAKYYYDFSSSTGWTLGTEWQIGNAAPGCGDPATDHTPTGDNKLAGAVIGGCYGNGATHGDYCLTSPVMNTSTMPTVWINFWRILSSDYPSWMNNKFQVWNGASWITIWNQVSGEYDQDGVWTQIAYDLTAYKNVNMQVRWCYSLNNLNGLWVRGGWSLDDITIAPSACNGP
jgi:hypothetical protein